ncbi:CYTH and CHAD domain-containing protein [Thermomonospora catenispora]|uniref:CYTH and CHAD domain-containing protein n=1 Tax=Thermomonospora catenispora TaxID=2493090 RepID=UPI0011225449|nr:CYTH and CHAD domain-containing protein [Thermomonospora catenispora]TNY38167.1 CYTH and CHAD domain-containing protein [Thermomonospora catenispora]
MADPKSQLEVERKYDADDDFTMPDLSGLPGVASVSEPRTHVLMATYFDTDDHRLAARGITLRRRRGGEDAGWHLKIPVGPDSKRELRASLGRPTIVPARLASLVAAQTRGAPLRPVATLETERTVVDLLDADGRVLAEVTDDVVVGRLVDPAAAEGAEPPATGWREIEVELGPAGEPGLLKAAGKLLKKAGARKADGSAKLSRVLAPVMTVPFNGGRPRPAAAPPHTAGAAVLGYLARQVEAVLEFDPKARLAEFDAVHRMRVATRRIRSALKSFAPVLDAERIAALEPELRWLAAVLGEVRDLEVLRMRFTDRLARPLGFDVAEPQSWLEELAKREKSAYRRLNAHLKTDRYFALLDALDALLTDPPLGERADRAAVKELPRLVGRQWRRMAKKHAAIAVADDPEEARHDLRKAAKRVRYAAELAAAALADLDPARAEAARRTAADAKRLQEVLGGHQDGVIAMEWLKGAAAERGVPPREAFVLGVLYGVERCEALESLSHLEETWRRISS